MRYLPLLLLTGWASIAAAQSPTAPDTLLPCGVTSSFLEKHIDPQLLKQMNAQWQAYSKKSKANGRLSADDPVLVVPVMFHIAHKGEAVGEGSNLSEGQIQTALATLNNMYRARGMYAAANDTRIELVLANCSGIDRADASGVPNFLSQGVSVSDGNQQQQVRDVFGTYQDKFVNIYVCPKISDAGGFAYYGGDMFIPVYMFSKSGSAYTSSLTFAHEMGHSLFLNHTFQGDNSCLDCSNNNVVCPVNTDPSTDGDQVADTPPHRVFDVAYETPPEAVNPCTGEPFGMGLVKNHMAYYNDANRFTPGQIARMRFYLETYLTKWLNSDAIPTPNDQLSLSSVPTSVCANSSVTIGYSNNSGNPNPVLLIQKGDEVIHYIDVDGGLVNFSFPTNYFNIPWATPLLDGNHYSIRLVAGCNSKSSAAIQYGNVSAYQAYVVGADGEPLPNISTDGYLYLCSTSSITLKAKLASAQTGVQVPVPEAEQSGLNFQWTRDGSNIPNANQNSYTASGLSGTYRFTVMLPGCSNQSTTSYGINTRFDVPPSVYTSDLDNGHVPLKNQCLGVRLYSTYISNSAAYAWYRDGLLIPGETGRILVANSAGNYKVVTTDGSCFIDSNNNKEVAVNFSNLLENTIRQPEDSILCGNSIYLSTTAWAEGLSYQWLRNGVEVPDGNQDSYFTQEAGTYSLRLRQGTCSSVSNAVHLYKADKAQKPVIIAPATFTDGLSHYLASYPYSYQRWYRDGQPAQTGYNDRLPINTSGVYTVRRGNGACTSESDPLVVNFGNTLSPVITTTDSVRLICNSSTTPLLTFEDRFIENPSSLSYRWTKDGIDVPLNNYEADKNALHAYEDGVYRLRVSMGSVTGVSNPITISSTRNRTVRLTTLEGVRSACEGTLIKLNFPPLSQFPHPDELFLSWKRDGVTIPNQHITELLALQSGSYTATYQGYGCTVTTEPKEVTIASGSLTATLSGNEAIRAGGSANLLLQAPAGFDSFFQLSDGSEYASQDSITLIPKSPALSTTYTLTSFGTHCGPGTALGVGRIDVTNCPVDVVNYTLASGFWDIGSNWSCGSIPTVLDPVRISDSHTIYLPANYEAKSKNIELLGKIQQDANSSLRIGQE